MESAVFVEKPVKCMAAIYVEVRSVKAAMMFQKACVNGAQETLEK
ncbi:MULTISPECIES: hypothetical protein [Methanobacterium]|uniref:Uncharacterized protein n=1 Tax=Methanobacterium veterum TaxID=408577 RepID=A0A9E5DNL2_9EURY|nr:MULTISPECIES: hypothetical protein [Methanobacterium]MCZ3372587.1 hypothetical protein [Methanobacterium veterum]